MVLIQITVLPQPVKPDIIIANAGNTETVTLPNKGTLNANGSTSSSGFKLGYLWTKISGPVGDTLYSSHLPNTAVSFLNNGNYNYKVIVSDSLGNKDSATVLIIVNSVPIVKSGPSTPVIVFDTVASVKSPTDTLQLNASHSYSNGGPVNIFYWTQDSGPTALKFNANNNANPTITNFAPGNYLIHLKIVDSSGSSVSKLLTLVVPNFTSHSITPRIRLYPNPVRDQANLILNNSFTENGTISVFDMSVRLLYHMDVQKAPGATKISLDLSSLSWGMYILQYQSSGYTQAIKFLKQK